jgi:hypothetical protein
MNMYIMTLTDTQHVEESNQLVLVPGVISVHVLLPSHNMSLNGIQINLCPTFTDTFL